MSRPLRVEFPGAFYHVFARGNDKREIFNHEVDYRGFLTLVGEAAERWDLALHAYALMPNHYHLLLEAKGGFLSQPMKYVNGLHGQAFNHRHGRVGHLLQGRFKAILVDQDRYLLTLSRYIHQNPVKAGLVDSPEKYRWSSCRAFAGLVEPPAWLSIGMTLSRFGSTLESQHSNYIAFLGIQEEPDPSRFAVRQIVLGSEDFLKKVQGRVRPGVRPRV